MVIGNMDITYPKNETTIDEGKVKIETGTVTDGKCTATAKDITGKAKITPATQTEGPKLTIKDITNDAAVLDDTGGALDASVNVDTEKGTLTIKYTPTQAGKEKCIIITLGDSDSITKAGGGDTQTVAYGNILTEGFDTILSH